MLNVEDVKRDFPVLKNRDLIYLDNAATTLTPEPVIQSLQEYYKKLGASVHRGIYQLANETTEEFERARNSIADYIGANSPREIVLTKNCTEGINVIAYSLERWQEKSGKVLVTEMDHHSNILPWRFIANGSKKFQLEYVEVTKEGRLDIEDYKRKLSPETVAVAFPGISNVLGTVNPIKEVTNLAHENDALVILDGAQWLPHRAFDLSEYGVDFLTFSAHKMLGPTGLGVLYGREELLRMMPPPFGGGEMVLNVTRQKVKLTDPPQKFEPGTPPIAQTIAFKAALDYLEKLEVSQIKDHVDNLTQRAVNKLSKIPYIDIYGPKEGEPRGGLVSFNLEGVHSHDLATALDSLDNIAIRAGLHCAQPLHEVLEINSSARVSFYVYNSNEDVDRFIAGVKEVKTILGGENGE
ncbi:SufS family cysteine desulfurase [Candidatus Bipolaricaulota bacterium]|nr:SufS family cysteine desulfurase [Candidatus Bipolaricaulota bacterium]